MHPSLRIGASSLNRTAACSTAAWTSSIALRLGRDAGVAIASARRVGDHFEPNFKR
jgi:hypothetical protein